MSSSRNVSLSLPVAARRCKWVSTLALASGSNSASGAEHFTPVHSPAATVQEKCCKIYKTAMTNLTWSKVKTISCATSCLAKGTTFNLQCVLGSVVTYNSGQSGERSQVSGWYGGGEIVQLPYTHTSSQIHNIVLVSTPHQKPLSL